MRDKLKRFLSLLLAFVMVLSIVPVSAEDSNVVVDETSTTEGSVGETVPVAKIADTEYATLTKAFEAAQDGDTIVLLENVDEVVRLSVSDADSVPYIVLDLNDKTWDCGYGTRINAVNLKITNGIIGTSRWSEGFDGDIDVFYFGGHAKLPSTMALTGVTFNAELRVNNMAPSDEELNLLKSMARSTGKAPNATTVIIEDGQFDVVTVQKAAYLTINGGFFSGINAEEGAIVDDNRNKGEGSDESADSEESKEIVTKKEVYIKTLDELGYTRTESGVTITFVDYTPVEERDYMQFTVGATSTTFTVQEQTADGWKNVEPESGKSTIKRTFTEPATVTYRLDWDNNGTFDRLIVLMKSPVAKISKMMSASRDETTNAAKGSAGEFATIEEAIANWTNGTTLTLLSDVTLSDVITLKSTEHHILDLGTHTMTAASGKNAIEIKSYGFSERAERPALTINADGTNPGGINAGSKSCIYYKYDSSLAANNYDRPIIYIKGGVFAGSSYSGISCSGHANAQDKCATFNISGGTFNCGLNLTKAKLIISGGTFNGSLSCTGGSTSIRVISGGTFKNFSFMTADAASKFAVGSAINTYDRGLYVTKDNYLVVCKELITDTSDFALSTTYPAWKSYLEYSSVPTKGLFYEKETVVDLVKVITSTAADGTDRTINLYQDFELTSPLTIKNNLTLNLNGNTLTHNGFVLTKPGMVLTSDTDLLLENVTTNVEGYMVADAAAVVGGKTVYTYTVRGAVAQIGETKYATLPEAVAAANAYVDAEGVAAPATVTLLADVELGEKLSITNNVTIEGAHTITRAADDAETEDVNEAYTGTLFAVDAGATLTLDGGLVIDGGNHWTMDMEAYNADLYGMVHVYKPDAAKYFTLVEDEPVATDHMITVNGGTVNLNAVTVQNEYGTFAGVVKTMGTDSVVTLTGATIKHIASTNNNGVVVFTDAANTIVVNSGTVIEGNHVGGNHGLFRLYSGATLTMNGGEIKNNTGWDSNGVVVGIYGSGSKFIMKDGLICSNSSVWGENNGRNPAVYVHSDGEFLMTGGTICHNIGKDYAGGIASYKPNSMIKITGGVVVENISLNNDIRDPVGLPGDDVDSRGTVVISGGTYGHDVFKWLAPNYGEVYDESTGYYTVTNEIVEVKGTCYHSIAAAVEAANAGNTVKVLLSHFVYDEVNGSAIIDKDITLDLNGQTVYSYKALESKPAIRVLANVTVKNGTVDGTQGTSSYAFIVGNGDKAGNLTIESGTYKGDVSAISVTKGTLNIEGGTFMATEYEGAHEFTLNCIDANYKDGSAKIYVQGGTFYKYDPANNAAEGANTNFVVEGYKSVADGDYYTVEPCEYVAQVGETKYEDLKEAIEACTNGETVKLIADITYDADDVVSGMGGATGFANYPQDCIVYIGGTEGATKDENKPSNVNAVIDLNGHSITNNTNAYLFLIMDNAKITFTGEGSITTKADLPAIWCCGTDTLVKIVGGSYSTTSSNGLLHATHAGDIVIDGGCFWTTADDASALLVIHSGKYNNPPYFLVGQATMTVNGGEFRGFNPEYTPDAKTDPVSYVNAVTDGMVAVSFSRDGETWWTPELLKAKIDYMKLGMFADEIIYPSDVADSLQGLVDYFMLCNAASEEINTGDYKPVLTINVDLDEKVIIGGASSDGQHVSAKPMTWTIELKGEFDPENIEPAQGYVKTKVDDDTYTVTFDYVEWVKAELLAGRDVTLDRDIVVDGSYIDSIPAPTNGNGKYPNYGIFNVVGNNEGKVTFDLNGHNITYNGHASFTWNNKTYNSCTVAHGLFFANAGAYLEICDSVGDSLVTVNGVASAVYAASPNSVINVTGGSWINKPCQESSCGATNLFLYASHGGKVIISAGNFSQTLDAEGNSYLIVNHNGEYKNDVIDFSQSDITIYGGTFTGMNPEEAKYFQQTADNKLVMGETYNAVADGYVAVKNADNRWKVEKLLAEIVFQSFGGNETKITYPGYSSGAEETESLQGLVDWYMLCNHANETALESIGISAGDYTPVMNIYAKLDESAVFGGASTDGTYVSAEPMSWTINTNGNLAAENIKAAECYVKTAVDEDTYTVTFDYVKWVQAELLAGRDVKLDRDIVINDYSYVHAHEWPSNGNGKYDECHGNGAVFHVIKPGVELDLNGHSITWDAHDDDYCNKRQVSLFMVTVTGNDGETSSLTVKDTAGNGKVNVHGMASGVYVVCDGAQANIDGGTWTNYPCSVESCRASNIFLYPSHGGTLNISAGIFQQKDSEYLVGLKGSTKETTNNGVGVDFDETKVSITGGTFVNFNPETETKFIDNANGSQITAVNGCANGYIAKKLENEENSWIVVQGAWVAQINDAEGNVIGKYEALSDAVAAVKSGETIVLLKDSDANFEVSGNIGLDVNGCSYTGTVTLTDPAATLTAVEKLNVTTTVENGAVVYEDGVHMVIVKFRFAAANVNVGNDLDMKFAFEKRHRTDWTGYYVHIVREYPDGTTHEMDVPFEEWETSGSFYVVTYSKMAAKEMADQITLVVCDENGNEVSYPWVDSMRAYAMRKLENATSDLERTALVDMLNYGAAAQMDLNYNSGDLADNLLTAEQKAWASEAKAVTDSLDHGELWAMSNFESKSNLIFKMLVKNVTSDMYAVVDYVTYRGAANSVTITGDKFEAFKTSMIIEINGVKYTEGRSVLNVTIYNADGTVFTTCSDSIEAWAYRNGKNSSQKLMQFCDSAREYLLSK